MKVCDKLLLLKEPKNSGIYKTDRQTDIETQTVEAFSKVKIRVS